MIVDESFTTQTLNVTSHHFIYYFKVLTITAKTPSFLITRWFKGSAWCNASDVAEVIVNRRFLTNISYYISFCGVEILMNPPTAVRIVTDYAAVEVYFLLMREEEHQLLSVNRGGTLFCKLVKDFATSCRFCAEIVPSSSTSSLATFTSCIYILYNFYWNILMLSAVSRSTG